MSDSNILITNSAGANIFLQAAAFNGISFTDVTSNPGIAGVLITVPPTA